MSSSFSDNPFTNLVSAKSQVEWDHTWDVLVEGQMGSTQTYQQGIAPISPPPSEPISYDYSPPEIRNTMSNSPLSCFMNDQVLSPLSSYSPYSRTSSPLHDLNFDGYGYPGKSVGRNNSSRSSICSAMSDSPVSLGRNNGKPSIPTKAFKKVHVDERRYFECTWANCQKRFTRLATNAHAHWNRHGQVKAYYVCQVCSMGFERMCDMRRHLNSSHSS